MPEIDPVQHAPRSSLLPRRLRLARLVALLESWLAAMDGADADAAATPEAFAIDSAIGAPLRVLARIVGAPVNADDEVVRILVRSEILTRRSRGSVDDVLEILDAVFPVEVVALIEFPPAAWVAGPVHDQAEDLAVAVARQLDRAASAGVGSALLWSPSPVTNTFVTSSVFDATESSVTRGLAPLSQATGGRLVDVARPIPARAYVAFWRATTTWLDLLVTGDRVEQVSGAAFGAIGTPSQDVDAGLFAGNGISDLAMEFDDGTTDAWEAPNTALGDVDNSSSALIAVAFRVSSTPAALRCLACKRPVAGVGWEVLMTATGAIRVRLIGATTADVTASADHSDDVLHVAVVVLDVTGSTVELVTDLAAPATVGQPTGSTSNASAMRAGAAPSFFAADALIPVVGVLVGAQAEAVTAASVVSTLRARLLTGA